MSIGRAFPVSDAQGLVTAFVRATEMALRRYEDARLRLARSVADDSLVGYLRGADDLASAFVALHRAMRLAEALVRSPETVVNYAQLPSEQERDRLRKMRNAIDHIDESIIKGRSQRGNTLELHVRDDDSLIDNELGTHQAPHQQLGHWVKTLHELATTLTNEPQVWASVR